MLMNQSKNILISNYYNVAGKFGLMFKNQFSVPYLFKFEKETRQLWHMFFVKFTIDIIFLDTSAKIIEVYKGLKPWNYYMPKRPSMYVIELPEGSIDRFKLDLGDKVLF